MCSLKLFYFNVAASRQSAAILYWLIPCPTGLLRQQENQAHERSQKSQNKHSVNGPKLDFRRPDPRVSRPTFVAHYEIGVRHA